MRPVQDDRESIASRELRDSCQKITHRLGNSGPLGRGPLLDLIPRKQSGSLMKSAGDSQESHLAILETGADDDSTKHVIPLRAKQWKLI